MEINHYKSTIRIKIQSSNSTGDEYLKKGTPEMELCIQILLKTEHNGNTLMICTPDCRIMNTKVTMVGELSH